MLDAWNRAQKLWAVAAALFALLSVALAGPVAGLFSAVAESIGRDNFDRVFSACEFIFAGVMLIWLSRRIQALGSLVWPKLLAWVVWGGAVALAETRNLLEIEHVHYFQYALLGLLLWRVLRGRIVWIVLLGGSVGLIDELMQGLVKGRVFDWADASYNLLGVLGGALIVWSATATKEKPGGFPKPIVVAMLAGLLALGGAGEVRAEDSAILLFPGRAFEALGVSPKSLGRSSPTGEPIVVSQFAGRGLRDPLAARQDIELALTSLDERFGGPRGRGACGSDNGDLSLFLDRVELERVLGGELGDRVLGLSSRAVATRRDLARRIASFSIGEREALEMALRQAFLPTRTTQGNADLVAPLRRLATGQMSPWAMPAAAALVECGSELERLAAETEIATSRSMTTEAFCARGDVLFFAGTPAGAVVIGGGGPTEYYCEDPLLLLDLGGDDIYRVAAHDAPAWQRQAVSVIIDVGGNDQYFSDSPGSLAGGFFGISVLIDSAGDDSYVARDVALGAGIMGAGVLIDRAGTDSYRARAFTQGAAAFGFGLLWDGGGQDQYDAAIFGQGAGAAKGTGVLIDRGGDDRYSIGGLVRDFREPDEGTVSYGQGYGFGHRELGLVGGNGWLHDLDGNDIYQASYFAQGTATYYGLGFLLDAGGNDRYLSRRYTQGAGVHMGAGFLIDNSGDDLYDAFGVAQGVGHDMAVGVLVDASGNDRYDLGFLGQGAARSGGMGLLLDGSGADRYWCGGKNSQGASETGEDPKRGSQGLLIDLGGQDFYTGKGKNNTQWHDAGKSAGKSAGIDMEDAAAHKKPPRKE